MNTTRIERRKSVMMIVIEDLLLWQEGRYVDSLFFFFLFLIRSYSTIDIFSSMCTSLKLSYIYTHYWWVKKKEEESSDVQMMVVKAD